MDRKGSGVVFHVGERVSLYSRGAPADMKNDSRPPRPTSQPSGRRFRIAVASVLIWLLPAGPAMAHKLTVFAAVQGKKVTGEVYFRGGAPARNARVGVLGPADEKLGETTTDEDGHFAFVPRVRCDHRLVVTAGEGHAAEFTVAADELPRGLPAAPAGTETAVAPGASRTGVPPVRAPSPGSPVTGETPVLLDPPKTGGTPVLLPPAAGESIAELADRLEGLQTQVVKLREDLVHYEDRIRLHDVLGGIGCILGFMGLVFYFLGVRRREKAAATNA